MNKIKWDTPKDNPYNHIVNRWTTYQIKQALKAFSYGFDKSSRRTKRDMEVIKHIPRYQLNELQVKHNTICNVVLGDLSGFSRSLFFNQGLLEIVEGYEPSIWDNSRIVGVVVPEVGFGSLCIIGSN